MEVPTAFTVVKILLPNDMQHIQSLYMLNVNSKGVRPHPRWSCVEILKTSFGVMTGFIIQNPVNNTSS